MATPPKEGSDIPPVGEPPYTYEEPPPPWPDPPSGCGTPITISTPEVEGRMDYRAQEWLKVPVPGALHALPLFESGRIGGALDPNEASPPSYKRNPHVIEEPNGQVSSWLPGYGDGWWVLGPGEFETWDAYGEDVLPGSRWPAHPPNVSLLLLSAVRSQGALDTYGANSITPDPISTYLAFGTAHQQKRTPNDGCYFGYDPSSGELTLNFTDSDGDDISDVDTRAFVINGKLTVRDSIDPIGLQLTPQESNPGDSNTLWVTEAGVLMFGASIVSLTIEGEL